MYRKNSGQITMCHLSYCTIIFFFEGERKRNDIKLLKLKGHFVINCSIYFVNQKSKMPL